MEYFTGEQVTFFELIWELIPDPSNPKERLVKGCQVLMPETAFFSEGKVISITTLDKDNCLSFHSKVKAAPRINSNGLDKSSVCRLRDSLAYLVRSFFLVTLSICQEEPGTS
jgi:hypothetical protein